MINTDQIFDMKFAIVGQSEIKILKGILKNKTSFDYTSYLKKRYLF